MSGCSPSTGYYANGGGCGDSNNALTGTPGKTVLFSPESPQGERYSPSFTVTPGRIILIDAYNMPYDQPIYVNRILKSNYAPRIGDNCDPCAMNNVYGKDGIITFRERMTLGVSQECWVLNKTENQCDTPSKLQLLIEVPGIYELELSAAEMLGDLQVEYMEWEVVLTPRLPSVYHAGVCTPCGGDI